MCHGTFYIDSISRYFIFSHFSHFSHFFSFFLIQCNESYFTWREREALARTIIRKHDVENFYHCNTRNCGQDCVFAIVTCPNEGCDVQFNAKHADKHDGACPQKVIECDRLCGEVMTRCQHGTHKEFACALRWELFICSYAFIRVLTYSSFPLLIPI